MRSFDRTTETRAIWWLDGRFPDQLDLPVKGRFEDGVVGSFYADDTFKGIPIRVRFLWAGPDPHTLRWEQAFSADNGATWEINWIMELTREPA